MCFLAVEFNSRCIGTTDDLSYINVLFILIILTYHLSAPYALASSSVWFYCSSSPQRLFVSPSPTAFYNGLQHTHTFPRPGHQSDCHWPARPCSHGARWSCLLTQKVCVGALRGGGAVGRRLLISPPEQKEAPALLRRDLQGLLRCTHNIKQ